MINFLNGITTCGCWGVAVFFLRYWRGTRDRLFLYFAVAFLILSLNWLTLVVLNPAEESRHIVFVLRLAAFLLIMIGIWDKNRGNVR